MDDIWAGDHLNREEDAGFLSAYLLQRNARAVEVGEKGTSLNISAPWGAGKSFFLSRFAKQLRADGRVVAEVNAWRDDHADDPIYPVMSAILTALGKSTKKAKLREALAKNAGKIAVRTGRGLVRRAATFVIGATEIDGMLDDVAKSIAEAGDEVVGELAEKSLERFEEGQRAIKEFRATIEREVKGKDPLFILVDELDRCRPTYAVSVLERVKHLFDVPNVIFVFATNSDELTHTIRAVYGIGFDADRYLLRFFDRTYQFDPPSVRQFVDAQWASLGLEDGRFLPLQDVKHQECLTRMAEGMKLSLRDIAQCMEITWSVAEFADRSVPVPLIFLFPLVAAYHTRNIDAFLDGAGETGALESFKKFCGSIVIWERTTYDRARDREVKLNVDLNQVASRVRTMMVNGISDYIQDDTISGRYIERYRSIEFSVLHQNQHRGGKVPSILSSYGSMIRRAGRVLPLMGETIL